MDETLSETSVSEHSSICKEYQSLSVDETGENVRVLYNKLITNLFSSKLTSSYLCSYPIWTDSMKATSCQYNKLQIKFTIIIIIKLIGRDFTFCS